MVFSMTTGCIHRKEGNIMMNFISFFNNRNNETAVTTDIDKNTVTSDITENTVTSETTEVAENTPVTNTAKPAKPKNSGIEYRNNVTLTGKVVHSFATDKITIVTLGIFSPKSNFPKVLFFGENRIKAAQFKAGDLVRIEGNIQSSIVVPGKGLKEVSVFGEDIKAMPGGEEIGGYNSFRNINRFELTGMVIDKTDWNNITKLYVRTFKNNHLSIVPVDYYYTDSNPLTDIKAGDIVCVKGSIQTKRKTFENETVYFENYVATDVFPKDICCDEPEQ